MAQTDEKSSQLGQSILISRTDKIGDVVLTLPLAGFLKNELPDCKIYFLGQSYTRTVIESCLFVDKFFDWKELERLTASERVAFFKSLNLDSIVHVFPNSRVAQAAYLAGVPVRVGVAGRVYHWLYCNSLAFVSRKRSELHEAQLNLKLLQRYFPNTLVPLSYLHRFYGLRPRVKLPPALDTLISRNHFNLVLHPKSAGSAREWPLESYCQLVELLPTERFKVFVTGGPAEAAELTAVFADNPRVSLLAGRLSLDELMCFIEACDGLIAASTGPLHLAAALGKFCLGIYPLKQPMHAARWGPVGKMACSISATMPAQDCQQSCGVKNICACMNSVTPRTVLQHVLEWESEGAARS